MFVEVSETVVAKVLVDKIEFYERKVVVPMTPELVDIWMMQQESKKVENGENNR